MNLDSENERTARLSISLGETLHVDAIAIRGHPAALEELAQEIRTHGYTATLAPMSGIDESSVRRLEDVRRQLYWLFED